MKIRNGFVLHQMGKEWVVVGVGEAMLHFRGMVRLNETGAFLWKMLSEGKPEREMIRALCETYRVSPDEAEQDTKAFLGKLKNHDIVE